MYYHDLMQLRREQQLALVNRVATPTVVPPSVTTNYRIVQEVQEVPRYVEDAFMCKEEGPTSRDWMLVLIMLFGAVGITFVICILLFLVLLSIGLISGGTP